MTDGIIVGSDQGLEWLLPWWWENYSRGNDFPVVFFDFGLSSSMKKWCAERGEVLDLISEVPIKERDQVAGRLTEDWEGKYGTKFWNYRKTWFKKPLACLRSPFQRTVWLDLDCEVFGNLAPLFEFCIHPSQIALAKIKETSLDYPVYNSGVIVFQKNASIIQEWAEKSLEQNDRFPGDQDVLSKLIFEKQLSISELPLIYHWNIGFGANPEMVICHWYGEIGKEILRRRIDLNDPPLIKSILFQI